MSKKFETDSKGIPLKAAYPPQPPVLVLYITMTTVFACISGTIAYITIVKDNEAAEAKLALLSQYDLGYLYAAFIVLRLGQLLMAANAGNTRKHAKIHPPDQHVYQVKGAEGSKLGYVLMDYDGANGKFNRAQRSVQNYQETYPQNLVYIVAAGFVYPKEIFVVACMYALCRLVMAVGYTASTDGRTAGFLSSNMISSMLEVLVGMIAYKTIV